MRTALPILPGKWPRKVADILISTLSFIVFLFFDFLDFVLCIFYRVVDTFLEGNASPCYCETREEKRANVTDDRESELSETLYGRKNVFREMGFHGMARKWEDSKEKGSCMVRNRWSDCGCETCSSWMTMTHGDPRLHIVVREPSKVEAGVYLTANIDDDNGMATENVIFLHGFLSSSLLWTETVFPNLSDSTKHDYKLFAVDLLGFGRSPKPRDCLYTLRDHIEMIEKSVIFPFQLNSFHLVAHSMGCIIALALASKYSNAIKSITLIAPPYFPSKDDTSLMSLRILAKRSLWPPLLFGSSVMSWYEHVGRSICLLICRNHRTWEWILKLLTSRRDLHFMVIDLHRHTHHSAWHTMHNVLCGAAKLVDGYLETLCKAGVKINLIHGSHDQVVPLECCNNIKLKVPDAEVNIITNVNHYTIIQGRERDFTRDLERIWASVADRTKGLSFHQW